MQQWSLWPVPCDVYDITIRTEPNHAAGQLRRALDQVDAFLHGLFVRPIQMLISVGGVAIQPCQIIGAIRVANGDGAFADGALGFALVGVFEQHRHRAASARAGINPVSCKTTPAQGRCRESQIKSELLQFGEATTILTPGDVGRFGIYDSLGLCPCLIGVCSQLSP